MSWQLEQTIHALAPQIQTLWAQFSDHLHATEAAASALWGPMCPLPFDTKMEVPLRADCQWTLWSCWKVGHKPAMWFSEPAGYSYSLKLPKANGATPRGNPTPSLHVPRSPDHAHTASLRCNAAHYCFRRHFVFFASKLSLHWISFLICLAAWPCQQQH